MEITIPFGEERKVIQIGLPPENIIVAASNNPSTTKTWAEVVDEAIHNPIAAEPINKQNLNQKQVVIIADDWGRPTPYGRGRAKALPIQRTDRRGSG